MRKLLLLTCSFLILSVACRKDRRERIFEMTYPNFEFQFPAGLSQFQARVFAFSSVTTDIDNYLQQFSTDTSAIAAISPLYANIYNDNNLDFDYLEEVSVRVCPVGQECTAFDEAFYLDNLRNRSLSRLQLLPTLRNLKPVLTGKNYRLEIVFFLSEISPFTLDCRLEMGFEAVR
ncbi:MAG: hypothetical protein R2824_25755 [Saprospiraceae bacterium]|nr:hypothetical protein [Lewinella sp.]